FPGGIAQPAASLRAFRARAAAGDLRCSPLGPGVGHGDVRVPDRGRGIGTAPRGGTPELLHAGRSERVRSAGVKRRVLVTGGSRGIGQAIAMRLASAGFAVSIHYHTRAEAAEKTLESVRAAGGEGALLQFDVADRAQCAARLQADLEASGP